MEAHGRPLRADAARNRARVLDAARTAFAEAGLDVGVEEIARRAGVGKGTLYRRFPTKEALVCAIFEDILLEFERVSAQALEGDDVAAAFTRFLNTAAEMQAGNQGFYDVVSSVGLRVITPEQGARFAAAAAGPLKRAQAAGAVRDDLTPDDLLIILQMLGPTTRNVGGESPDRWPRYLSLLLDAIRPAAATPLPPLTPSP
jgi:AcrR family transcriptional regulator